MCLSLSAMGGREGGRDGWMEGVNCRWKPVREIGDEILIFTQSLPINLLPYSSQKNKKKHLFIGWYFQSHGVCGSMRDFSFLSSPFFPIFLIARFLPLLHDNASLSNPLIVDSYLPSFILFYFSLLLFQVSSASNIFKIYFLKYNGSSKHPKVYKSF